MIPAMLVGVSLWFSFIAKIELKEAYPQQTKAVPRNKAVNGEIIARKEAREDLMRSMVKTHSADIDLTDLRLISEYF